MAAKAMVTVEAFPCIHRFRGHGPLLQDRWMRHPAWKWSALSVGAGHARLSGLTARGGLAAGRTNKGRAPCISPRSAPPGVELVRAFCRSGPCPRKRLFRVKRFLVPRGASDRTGA